MSAFTYLLSMSGAWGQYFRFCPISRSPTMGNQPCETRLHKATTASNRLSFETDFWTFNTSILRLDQLNRSKFKYISFQPAVINMDLSQVEDEIMNNKESQWIKVSLFKLISMFFQHFQSSIYYFQKTKDYHMIRRSRNQAFLTKIQKQFHHRYNFAKYSE